MVDKTRTIQEVDRFVEDLPKNVQPIVAALRNIILDSSPKLVEEFKWTMPNYTYNGLVCYLQTAKDYVNLGFFKGNELQNIDNNRLLQGTAKKMRRIKIKNLKDIQPEVLASLIQEAVALNEERVL